MRLAGWEAGPRAALGRARENQAGAGRRRVPAQSVSGQEHEGGMEAGSVPSSQARWVPARTSHAGAQSLSQPQGQQQLLHPLSLGKHPLCPRQAGSSRLRDGMWLHPKSHDGIWSFSCTRPLSPSTRVPMSVRVILCVQGNPQDRSLPLTSPWDPPASPWDGLGHRDGAPGQQGAAVGLEWGSLGSAVVRSSFIPNGAGGVPGAEGGNEQDKRFKR